MAIHHQAWPTGELPQRASRARRAPRAATTASLAAVPVRPAGDGPEAARTMMWGLEADGWSEREAGNLVGLAHGLRPSHAGWTEREIEHLRFLRALVESGRLDH